MNPDPERLTQATTLDWFLGDKIALRQPEKGYRAGIDAVLLAASIKCGTEPNQPMTLLDVGAGVGTVGLCAAARLPQLQAVLLDNEPAFVQLARDNASHNRLCDRVKAVCASITSSAAELAALGLLAESFDRVVANPPYHDEDAGTSSANPMKSAAHAMPADSLDDWCRFLARMVRPGGRATVIHKAEAMPRLLASMGTRFGAVSVFPIYPRDEASAIRVLVEGVKGSRAPPQIKRGLVLHGTGASFTLAATALLRHGAALEF